MNNKYAGSSGKWYSCSNCKKSFPVDFREFDYDEYDRFSYIQPTPSFETECDICGCVTAHPRSIMIDYAEN